jgi:hypothetical protein
MATNVEVIRTGSENALSLLRKFTKRVQGSGVLPRVRGLRYSERELSHYKTKMKTLKGINRRRELAELVKLGKAPEVPERRKR